MVRKAVTRVFALTEAVHYCFSAGLVLHAGTWSARLVRETSTMQGPWIHYVLVLGWSSRRAVAYGGHPPSLTGGLVSLCVAVV